MSVTVCDRAPEPYWRQDRRHPIYLTLDDKIGMEWRGTCSADLGSIRLSPALTRKEQLDVIGWALEHLDYPSADGQKRLGHLRLITGAGNALEPPVVANRPPLSANCRRQLALIAAIGDDIKRNHAVMRVHGGTFKALHSRGLVVYDEGRMAWVVTAAGRAEVAR